MPEALRAGMAEDDDGVTGVERLVVEEFLGIFLGALEPEQLAHAAGAENVVPHHAGVGERVEADIGAVARIGLLHRQHRVARAIEMDQTLVGERLARWPWTAASKAASFPAAAFSAMAARRC